MNMKRLLLASAIGLAIGVGGVGCEDMIKKAKQKVESIDIPLTDIAIDNMANDVLDAIAEKDTVASRVAKRAADIYINKAPDGLRRVAQTRYGVQLAPADWQCIPPPVLSSSTDPQLGVPLSWDQISGQ